MSEEFDIARVRRFNRAVTTALGAMDQSFLGRGRPLGVARALNAIGQGYRELRDLRAYLGVNSGLMSRTLRALESEGLIETEVGAGDARQRILSLTEADGANSRPMRRCRIQRRKCCLRVGRNATPCWQRSIC